MSTLLNPHQRGLLATARAVLDGKGTRDAFLACVERTDYENPRLAELIERMRRLPSASNALGVGKNEYAREVSRIRRLIEALETAPRQ